MKKIFVLAAIAAIALTASCTKNAVIETPQEEAINMSAFTPVATKSSVLTGTSLNPYATDFIVNAYQGTTQFMTNVDIQYKTTDWNYAVAADTKYWPNDETNKIDFYAYAPTTDASMVIGTDNHSMTVTAPVDNAAQKDVLYAQTLQCSKSYRSGVASGSQTSGRVKLVFKHALSQVNFKLQCTNSNLKVTVSGISIENVNNQIAETFAGVASTPATSVATTDYAAPMSSLVLTSEAVIANTSALLLAPQPTATTAWTKTSADVTGSRVAITCKIEDKTSGVVYYDAIAYVPASFNWESGKNYTYTINFKDGAGQKPDGENVLDIIEFTPSVTEWVPVSTDVVL